MTTLLALWLITGVVNYGGTFAFFQREFPNSARESYREDMLFAALMSLSGPFAFLASFLFSGFYKHGFKFW